MDIGSQKKRVSVTVSTYDVSLSEELKRVFPLDRQCKPELIVGKSEILDIADVDNIVHHVLRATSCSWSLAYSVSIHEKSLEGFYKRLDYVSATQSPLVIIIKDTEKNIHGVFLHSFDPLTIETTSAALFHCRPLGFAFFHGLVPDQKWIVRKTHELLAIVDVNAKCGIWLNGDLTNGKMEEYSGDSQIPIDEKRFSIKTLECWMLSDIQTHPQVVLLPKHPI